MHARRWLDDNGEWRQTRGVFRSIGRGVTSNRDVKRRISVGVVLVVVALLCVLGVAQVVLDTSSSPAPSMPWPGNSLSNASVIPFPGSNSQFSAFAPAWKPQPRGQLFAPSARLHPAPPSAGPTTGVYRTAPYSCIVVVPGPLPDDRSIVSPRGGDSSMPIIKPDLQFIPLHPAKK